ncbi:MAG: ABC transporter ATP-binding protein, partial [Geodermatophilaceae bacterium]
RGVGVPVAAEQDSGRDRPTAVEPLVLMDSVSRYFPNPSGEPVRALVDVSLQIEAGEVVAFMGPSGSGKSTLLHLLGAMLPPDSGRIVVGGSDVAAMKRGELVAYRRTIGFVFQRFQLLPALSALGNVMAPVLPYRRGREVRPRAAELLETVGLGERTDAVPAKLSGGQQQRVAIARALINTPRLVLADEPTGNLDSDTGAQIVDLLLKLRDDDGVTLVVATHDEAVASRCDRVVRLRDGRVVD